MLGGKAALFFLGRRVTLIRKAVVVVGAQQFVRFGHQDGELPKVDTRLSVVVQENLVNVAAIEKHCADSQYSPPCGYKTKGLRV